MPKRSSVRRTVAAANQAMAAFFERAHESHRVLEAAHNRYRLAPRKLPAEIKQSPDSAKGDAPAGCDFNHIERPDGSLVEVLEGPWPDVVRLIMVRLESSMEACRQLLAAINEIPGDVSGDGRLPARLRGWTADTMGMCADAWPNGLDGDGPPTTTRTLRLIRFWRGDWKIDEGEYWSLRRGLETAIKESFGDEGEQSPSGRKPKRSTTSGEARIKLIAALTAHHEYEDGGCLNWEPIGCRQLADLADVSEASSSRFFMAEFGGHSKYKATCARGAGGRLIDKLRNLNGESPLRTIPLPHNISEQHGAT